MNVKGKLGFIVGFCGLIGSIFITNNEVRSTILKISLGFVISGAIEFIAFLFENRKKWGVLKTHFFKRNKPVRVTIAYLFRIEENGQYALIKRHKKDFPGYQPIGGAYKYLKEENRELFDKLGIEPCNKVPRDEDTENDLRIVVKKRKNLNEFLKWFESRKNREIDPIREFFEELVQPGLLPENLFRHFKYVFVCKHIEGVLPSPVFSGDELRYAEVFELRLETDAQKKAIHELRNKGDEILFATPDEIRKGASNNGHVIRPHTFKILPK